MKKRELLLAYTRQLSTDLKVLDKEWQNLLPGLLTELAIHGNLLRRIKHQFRSSKTTHRCQSMQSCSRRLQDLRRKSFRSELAKEGTFMEIVARVLRTISDIGNLLFQLAKYSELASESVTQNLSQEHYFFFGSDMSILAAISRVWVISNTLLKAVSGCWQKLRTGLKDAGLMDKLQNVPDTPALEPIEELVAGSSGSTDSVITYLRSGTHRKKKLGSRKRMTSDENSLEVLPKKDVEELYTLLKPLRRYNNVK